MDDAVVGFRIDIFKGQVFELLLDGIDAEAVGQRRVDIQRFPGDGGTAFLRLMTEGSHVVQAVCQLDEHDADILGHGQDHLAEGFCLGFLPVGKIQFVQLGSAVDETGNFILKIVIHLLAFAVQQLDAIVEIWIVAC